jgi:hypothetical protein
MNMFEFSFFATPIAGAIGGWKAVKSSDFILETAGVMIGFAIGIALIYAIRGIVVFAEKINPLKRISLILIERFVLLIAVLSLMILPILAFMISKIIIGRILHL